MVEVEEAGVIKTLILKLLHVAPHSNVVHSCRVEKAFELEWVAIVLL
jgi:hypothetical protein